MATEWEWEGAGGRYTSVREASIKVWITLTSVPGTGIFFYFLCKEKAASSTHGTRRKQASLSRASNACMVGIALKTNTSAWYGRLQSFRAHRHGERAQRAGVCLRWSESKEEHDAKKTPKLDSLYLDGSRTTNARVAPACWSHLGNTLRQCKVRHCAVIARRTERLPTGIDGVWVSVCAKGFQSKSMAFLYRGQV